jgi:ribosome-associated protein
LIAKPSKSARKRENLALQSLGEELIALTDEQLATMNLDERLLEAVTAARSMRAHGALRRQKQLIGKLMRNVDPEPIRDTLASFGAKDRLEKRIFREAEAWRDRITGQEPGAVEALLDYLGHDCPGLSDAVSAFLSAPDDRARKHSRRRVFRVIHDEVARKVQNTSSSI